MPRPSPGQAWRRNVDAVSADRAWCVGLNRRLNGWDTAGDAMASAANVAKIGQLLLNGGACDPIRFFKTQTVE